MSKPVDEMNEPRISAGALEQMDAIIGKYPTKPSALMPCIWVIMDELGYQGEQYRESVYTGFSGNKSGLGRARLLAFVDRVKAYLDHSIALNRREDGLFHA